MSKLFHIHAILVALVLPLASAAQPAVAAAQPYEGVAQALERYLEREVAAKRLPALSIALVDDQKIVWARGFGYADAARKVPATAETVYRVGSVSKLFTDIGIMQLVEQGKIDLDAPVTMYLPDFKPRNPFGKEITLRQLMAHRSGLTREPPVGHYFDPTNPTLEETVRSLNGTDLVYAPETKIKYSNAAIAAVGLVLERMHKQPFAQYLQRAVLEPIGLHRSSFEATPDLNKHLCHAVMWTYDGRTFDAPTFPLGMAPAGSLYSTANDLGRFLSVLFAGGMGSNGRMLRPETLEKMYEPQFAKPGTKNGFGIGFMVSELEGKRRIGHGGAVYGFATELAALPSEKLGVAVINARDCANAISTHVADTALRLMLAARQGKPLPAIPETKPLPPQRAKQLAGRYGKGDKAIDLIESAGRLYLQHVRGGFRMELRELGDDLVTDDPLDMGQRLRLKENAVVWRGQTLERVPVAKPGPAPARWAGLIGEYGWDHNVLYILEKEGKLHALIEWFFLYPLEEVETDVFKFPNWGLYDGEKLIFQRNDWGKATQVEAAALVWKRRPIDGEDGTFRIRPLKPVEELRRQALAAKPPDEGVFFRKPDLVELTSLDPTIKLDVRYATADNFLNTPLYTQARAFLQRPAAEALVRVHRKLEKEGYGLLVHDGYRPWYVTWMFWEATPPVNRLFVADPARGSRHNRGMAVDLTLYDRKTGKAVTMVGGYDEMSPRSYPDYPGGTALQRWHRDLLRRAMEEEGFTVYEAEWWHFDYKDWNKYPISNVPFEEIAQVKGDDTSWYNQASAVARAAVDGLF